MGGREGQENQCIFVLSPPTREPSEQPRRRRYFLVAFFPFNDFLPAFFVPCFFLPPFFAVTVLGLAYNP